MIEAEQSPPSALIDTSLFANTIVAGSQFNRVAKTYCDSLVAAVTDLTDHVIR